MAFTKTVIVAVVTVAAFAQLSLAACPCGCAAGSDSGYERAAPSREWLSIPRDAVYTRSEFGESCSGGEIRVPDQAPYAVGIVQRSRPVCAQHLSYDIEVPVENKRPIVPSYHSVNIEVPVRERIPSSYTHLPYSVEVPVEEEPCRKFDNMNVEIAVPVRQRQVETRLHSTYTVEVPEEQRGPRRLTNLKAQVDRIVLPAQETCLPPNNQPVPVQRLRYVAVPAEDNVCPSPVGLLGLRATEAAPQSGSGSCSCDCSRR